jgi:hypothetical protein
MTAWNPSKALNTGFPLRKQNGAHPGSPKPGHTNLAASGTTDISAKNASFRMKHFGKI